MRQCYQLFQTIQDQAIHRLHPYDAYGIQICCKKELMRFRHTAFAALILLSTAPPALPQGVPPDLPKHLEAVAPNQNFASAKTITVSVTSRRPENPDTPEDLEHLRRRVLKTLPKTPFTLVPDKASAELSLELIVEPNVRYGMFHYQNAPYVYLTLREAPGGRLIYCAYQRAGHFYSASERLLHDLEHNVQHTGTPPRGSLDACAKQAMRPL
jgi:hypothetical protein